MKITGEFEGYASLVEQIVGTENLFLEIDILKHLKKDCMMAFVDSFVKEGLVRA